MGPFPRDCHILWHRILFVFTARKKDILLESAEPKAKTSNLGELSQKIVFTFLLMKINAYDMFSLHNSKSEPIQIKVALNDVLTDMVLNTELHCWLFG